MHKRFDHQEIEKKWQEKWNEDGIYNVGERDESKEKEYVLVELPYPSGNLHIGHWYAFAVPDIYVRHRRMTGKQVIYPMGFDAFGLPAENAAIKRGLDPRQWTEGNIEYMKGQLASMGNAFSWDKTATTINPSYYRWTQWMFTQFYENGIAYRGQGVVNWCPGCHTVIANEQVLSDNTCERCSNSIEKKKMPQWMLRITDFADELIDDLEPLNWPEHIKDAQRNWIGRSKGAEIDFAVNNISNEYRSYIMGVDTDIIEKLRAAGIQVLEKTEDGDLKVRFEKDKVEIYEHIIKTFLKPGFWNEYVGNTTRFIFKNQSGKITTYTWTIDNEVKILELCSKFANRDFESISIMISDNEWYRYTEHTPAETVTVFTTRPDTLFGATYLVLAPEHALVEKYKDTIENWSEVEAYVKVSKQKTEQDRLDATKEKTGVRLEGITATNPANGEVIPVYIADYVLAGYGTGAIMAVPAHDERDFAFAKKYGIEIKYVIDKIVQNHKAVGAIIVNKKGEFLLQKRTGDAPSSAGKIGAFGGMTEDGESALQVLTRELEEELGLDLSCNGSTPRLVHLHQSRSQPGMVNAIFLITDVDDTNLVVTEGEVFKCKSLAETGISDLSVSLSDFDIQKLSIPMTEKGVLINSGEFDGMSSDEAIVAVTKKVGGRMTNTYRLRDWSIGRQRYWGVPIPIVYDPTGKAHIVPKEHLPWTLPSDVDFTPTGEPPLAKSAELKKRTEEIFGKGWTPEVETMDTFVDSSWYFLRYLDNQNSDEFCNPKAQRAWLPVDLYFGGAEHTTMHLLYSRFWQKALKRLGLVEHNEPYQRRINRGLILGPDGNKMSKSKGNVIDPDEQVARVGADTVKMYLAFMGPYGEAANYPWDMGGIAGLRRFLERVNGLAEHIKEQESEETLRLLHKTIAKVSADISEFKFNTAISALMIFVNHCEKNGLSVESYNIFLQLLAPFAPHLTDELYARADHKISIHNTPWPKHNPDLSCDKEVTIGVQINGKIRGQITLSPEATEDEALAAVKANEALATKFLTTTPIKVVYRPGRILNLILPD